MTKPKNPSIESKSLEKKFMCSCGTHLIEVSYCELKTKKGKEFSIPELSIVIYDVYNPKTGRKYRKPKLVGDVLFLGSDNYGKEMDNIMDFLEDIVMAYIIRKK